MSKQYIFLKHGVEIDDLLFLNPKLLTMIAYINLWCFERGLIFQITSMYRKQNDGISKSRTHSEWRAADISIRGWSLDEIDDLVFDLNDRFKHIAAISASDHVPRAAIYGDSKHLDHIHVQCRP